MLIENTVITNVTGGNSGTGVILSIANNNNLTDIQILYSSLYDVLFPGSSSGNIFLNTSYNISKETIGIGSEITRKWYYQTTVNDSNFNILNIINTYRLLLLLWLIPHLSSL